MPPNSEARKGSKQGAWLWWVAKTAISVLALQKAHRSVKKRMMAFLTRSFKGTTGRRAFVFLAQMIYLSTAFEVLLFRHHLLVSIFPQANKLFRRLDMEYFIKADQTLPCSVSHPGISCHENAGSLWAKWWQRVPAAYIMAQFFFHAVSLRPMEAFLKPSRFTSIGRSLLFLFISTGVPGYVWCLSKTPHKMQGANRAARMPGLFAASSCGALATLIVPLDRSVSFVSSFYIGSALAILWSQLQSRKLGAILGACKMQ